jgi:hypothetical protein
VGLASRGQRQTDRGVEAVNDSWLAGQLRRQAREVLIESVLIATFVTGVLLLAPD